MKDPENSSVLHVAEGREEGEERERCKKIEKKRHRNSEENLLKC